METRAWTVVLVLGISGAMYPLLLYPALLWIWSRIRSEGPSAGEGLRPTGYSVIIPAHNEEKVIDRKLRNTLVAAREAALDYQIIVAADGCTDRTCEIVGQFPEIEVVEVRKRGGIVGAFRAGLEVARHDIVFFSDADIEIDPHTFRVMLRHFRDPRVGGVCGSTRMTVQERSGLGAEQINVFLRRWVRLHQSQIHSSVGADGANWALRRKHVAFPTNAQLAEDLVMPLGVVRSGERFVYEPDAGAIERSPSSVSDEYHRKVRTVLGGIQAAAYCSWMFHRPHLAIGFHYVSWKLWKYSVPFWVVVTFIAALMIPTLRIAAAAVALTILALATTGGIARKLGSGSLPRPLEASWYAVVAATTPIVAVARLIRRRTALAWRMAAR